MSISWDQLGPCRRIPKDMQASIMSISWNQLARSSQLSPKHKLASTMSFSWSWGLANCARTQKLSWQAS